MFIDESGYLNTVLAKRDLQKLIRETHQVDFFTDGELLRVPAGDMFVFDTECFKNYWCIAFKHSKSGKLVAFERSPDTDFNSTKLNWMLWRFCLVGFNSINYDIPMITLALTGATCAQLKAASDDIIIYKLRAFDFERQYKIKVPRLNHIDLMEVAPLQGSLKLYAGRLHAKRMQDLPFDENTLLTKEQGAYVLQYCGNDLENTFLLLTQLAKEIKLRAEMSQEYGVDLRSKSDAQIAEAVINSELKKILGSYPKKPKFNENELLKFKAPDFIKFRTKELNDVFNLVLNLRFELDATGSPLLPDELKKMVIPFGHSAYTLRMGGLHSTESKTAHIAADDEIIADNDVESFYPRIILNQELFPAHLGRAFLTVYEYIVNKRVDAKGKASALKATDKIAAAGFKSIADSLKIVINGSFGKLGNKYSTLYSPQLMLQVTLTGQLSLLMLIERLEMAEIAVISGNTDGIISKYKKDRHNEVRAIIAEWEKDTNFKTEETQYKAVYSRDVNTYVAVKFDNDLDSSFLDEQLGCKTKGAFCERGSALNSVLSKNPESLICSDALLQYIVNKKPIRETVTQCNDIRRFVSVRNVKGGGHKNGVYLGKVVRWYYGKGETAAINYVGSGNKVAKTQGAVPLMDLPETMPTDLDYEYYIKEAEAMLYECGAKVKPQSLKLF